MPEAGRGPAADVLVRIPAGARLGGMGRCTREGRWQTAAAAPDPARRVVNSTIAAISDSQFYGAPAWLQLDGFEASAPPIPRATLAEHATRLSGRNLLFSAGRVRVLYIRERRLFVLAKPKGASVAMSSIWGVHDVGEPSANTSKASP